MSEAVGDLGELLRGWRSARGWSQLDLALRAGLSQRHLSFVESGRSRASRKAVTALGEALEVPLRDLNTLLLAAGYAPAYAEGGFDQEEMRGVSAAKSSGVSGPKSVTVRIGVNAAKCAGPLSFVTSTSASV